MRSPLFLRLCLGSGAVFLAAAYWLHVHSRRHLASLALLVSLSALVLPVMFFAPSDPASAPRGATQFQVDLLNQLLVDRRLAELAAADMAKDPRRLSGHEATIYSQSGEDGIIAEIFRRVGVTNRYFVEFGSGDGRENNTVLLLVAGWSGLWLEAHAEFVKTASETFQREAGEKRLIARQAFVTAENIEDLLRSANVPRAFDLLSIDIDRNDYWVWKAIGSYQPRVVVIEYNAVFPPGVSWVVNYEPTSYWDGSSHFGASLTALERLAREKGYSLVGCNLLGSNAFFVRSELAGDKFASPLTAENHFQPARYYFAWYKSGHPRRVQAPGQVEYRKPAR
ncbi:MAG: hypothetical protein ACREUU_09470 [Gammaproteobacteria bacterium]